MVFSVILSDAPTIDAAWQPQMNMILIIVGIRGKSTAQELKYLQVLGSLRE